MINLYNLSGNLISLGLAIVFGMMDVFNLANDANKKFLEDYTAEYKSFTDRRVHGQVTNILSAKLSIPA